MAPVSSINFSFWSVAMKLIWLCLAVLVVSSCTSLKPVELAPSELQAQILAGQVIEPGDSVHLVTADGIHHNFRVNEVSSSHVVGQSESVAIDQIVALESRRFSGGKTALLAGGTLVLYQLLAALAVAFTLGL